ncbi:unnamed protein product [Coffea canephora]|uniref:EXS domain-containing protein n=1 Tax=Coffea canephora TaxID=49390 RepID=A0A068UTS0_COFCA|nr:unnamed protein product [Coffea canephora]
MTAVVTALLIHLILLSNKVPPTQVDAIPGVLLLSLGNFSFVQPCDLKSLLLLDRMYLLIVSKDELIHLDFGIPMKQVLQSHLHFFMADQLTSQAKHPTELYSCYFIAGSFKTHRYATCKSGKMYRELAYVISFEPYYWRAMRVLEHLIYLTANSNPLSIFKNYDNGTATDLLTIYPLYHSETSDFWMIIVLVTSLVATVYQLYWDFVKDWGLLNPKSRNLWLRDDLILRNKCIYYISIAFNLVLRVASVETVMHFNNIGNFESRMLDFLQASSNQTWAMELLQNEDLNNVGKFRAVKNSSFAIQRH